MIFVEILLPVFLLIGAGVLFDRVMRPALDPLTQFALYFATPALVLYALLRHPVAPGAVLRLLVFMVLYTVALWALAWTAGRLLRLPPEASRAFALATVPMNVGNYGLPLVAFAFGPESESFSVLLFVVFNIPLCTWAIWVAAGGGSRSRSAARDALRIPIFHATVLAFAISWSGWRLPEPVLSGLGLLGQAAIPLLLVMLGVQLARTRVTAEGRTGLAGAALLRLAISPVVAYGLCALLGYTGLERKVAILQTSTPSAVLPLLYALRFGTRPDWIASSILVTTLLSALTLGFLLFLLI